MQTKIEAERETNIQFLQVGGEHFYKISNSDAIRPFFMSIVSDSNHWMFISSNGGLTAGRKDADHALFPYYTDDKITESAELTGSKSIFLIHRADGFDLWEPFSERFDGMYRISRNLYKNVFGNKILFEEVNHDLNLTFRYAWNNSNLYGFVKQSELLYDGSDSLDLTLLDGVQNVLPSGVGAYLQSNTSNLVDAYKRSELDKKSGLGIYALSARIVDKAEPAEALTANVVWSAGLENPTRLVSSMQLKNFRKGLGLKEEEDVKAEKGAYFVSKRLTLQANESRRWIFAADVNKNQSNIAALSREIVENADMVQAVREDIDKGTKTLVELNASADALQCTADHLRDTRHFSNTLFNIMRGGIFDCNYQVEKWDFEKYLEKANPRVFNAAKAVLKDLPATFTQSDLLDAVSKSDDAHFKRLCYEYLPLKFSRRHGDPSRPWNRFSINTRSEVDGSKILDYEGNWRDIFQNWEALAISFPEFTESMIHKFLNATTFDGYNPYRITKDGFDWETIEPDDPWSYIGYWGDHQIIYLLKLLEIQEDHHPGRLQELLREKVFVYANVPYKIKSYRDILKNSKDTIDFDHHADQQIRHRREQFGADGALLQNAGGDICQVNFLEKIMATLLAKISNFIPEGGIWMNTQRPEWNDANNALVGNGVSMVTLYYLRRFLKFLRILLHDSGNREIPVSEELKSFFGSVQGTLEKHKALVAGRFDDAARKKVMDGLGQAGSDYRWQIYQQSFSGKQGEINGTDLLHFVDLCLQYLEHSIRANKRADNLYHAYNLVTLKNDTEASISYLSEMLEGQVAVLSSGFLSPAQVVEVLDALKQSALFREDQYSYVLYPNKNLPRFREKNNIPESDVKNSALLSRLVEDNNLQILSRDVDGVYHFNGKFMNAGSLGEALTELESSPYASLVAQDREKVLSIFEEVFNHKAFTGRSGTFFGYEGLGSIYWHMVSKLQLAVMECCVEAFESKAEPAIVGRMLEHYYEINAGIGVHKSPKLYGAFPTDPYSHTPAGRGAQQPGMTGQVKEDILSRFGELGVFVQNGQLEFNPCLLRRDEFLKKPASFSYVNVEARHESILLEKDSLGFTYCQIPVIYQLDDENGLEVFLKDGQKQTFDSLELNPDLSQAIFQRSGEVVKLVVRIQPGILR